MPHQFYKILAFLGILALFAEPHAFSQEKVRIRKVLSIKPTTDFDQRFYYTPGERQNVWGYRGGALINDRYKLGIGGYYMDRIADEGTTATSFSRTTEPATLHQQLYLGTIYYEPYLLRRNLWETSLVFETGYGRTVNYSIDKTTSTTTGKINGLLIPAGIGLSLNLKPPALFNIECLRWVGINAMAGYRTTIYQEDKRYDYNGAYWSLSGAIFLDRIFEDYHTWKKARSERRNSRVIQLSY